jgi:hypothetical protein
MDWMNTGSKTLVACAAIVGIAVMACFRVVTGEQAMGLVSLIWLGYSGANLYQNGKTTPAPPAEGK